MWNDGLNNKSWWHGINSNFSYPPMSIWSVWTLPIFAWFGEKDSACASRSGFVDLVTNVDTSFSCFFAENLSIFIATDTPAETYRVGCTNEPLDSKIITCYCQSSIRSQMIVDVKIRRCDIICRLIGNYLSNPSSVLCGATWDIFYLKLLYKIVVPTNRVQYS